MGDDKKTIANFLVMINLILGTSDIVIDMELTKERCLERYANRKYEDEFVSIDLCDLEKEDSIYIHTFITTKGTTREGYSFAKVKDDKLTLEFVHLDSVYPPIDHSKEGDSQYKEMENDMKIFVPILMESLNQYLKS